MERICLHNVIPDVFKDNGAAASEVWGRDVAFERGCSYLLQAASGSGKSTLCSYVTGSRRDYSGAITFDGRDIGTFGAAEWTDIRKLHVSLLYQDLRLFSELTALENVEIKNRLTRHCTEKQIRSWFERLGIAGKMGDSVGRMSFGQQQRVAFIRALAQPFDFIILDEPVSHIDDGNARSMCGLLCEEVRRRGAGCIVTSIGKHFDMDYTNTMTL